MNKVTCNTSNVPLPSIINDKLSDLISPDLLVYKSQKITFNIVDFLVGRMLLNMFKDEKMNFYSNNEIL